ncbi:hypothetical protein M378DRAFT_519794 [Amanita muscaria Koide BX008]|uniref:Secreted protein n=1 Tax=Amanita muscaria (strain Koide BX008) TaxID=946122 RepID=A0A0C2SQQ5_AMAMK|nr:hypothetical protein M378DRAFT_519794 [Amanita muscaria Koide BX008]
MRAARLIWVSTIWFVGHESATVSHTMHRICLILDPLVFNCPVWNWSYCQPHYASYLILDSFGFRLSASFFRDHNA